MADLKTNFNLRNSTSTKPQRVYLVCRWNKQRLVYPTDVSLLPNLWDAAKQLPKTKHPTYAETKYRLQDIKSIAENEYRKFINDSEESYLPTVEELREVLYTTINGVDVKPKMAVIDTFFAFIDEIIEERKEGLNENGEKYNRSSAGDFKTLKVKIEGYLKTKKIKPRNFDFNDVDIQFHKGLTSYLQKKNFSKSYIGKIIKNLKVIMNLAYSRKLHSNLDFKLKEFKVYKEETLQPYLTPTELQLFAEVDLSDNPRLDRVRDLLLLGAWTGLRFGDFTTISKSDIHFLETEGGYIEKKTKKTGQTVVIPILPPIYPLLKKYQGITINNLPKPISNQKFNEYIKELGQMVGLDEPFLTGITKGGMHVSKHLPKYKALSSHVCRRSFATNAFKMGVPIVTIMAITGHKTEGAFLLYIRETPKEHADNMREIMTRKLNPPIKKVG